MQASVEISMYPLDKEYGNVILDFIKRLNQYPNLKVQTNSMSTQVFGNYDELMTTLQKEIKVSFEQEQAVVMVMKVINMDLA